MFGLFRREKDDRRHEQRAELSKLVHKTLELDRKRVELDKLNRLAEGALKDLRRSPHA